MKVALQEASAVIVIGYSFGIQDDGSLADWRSFNVLRDAFAEKPPTPILVVNPSGQNLADLLEESLEIKCVTCFPVYWHRLVAAMDILMATAQEYSLNVCKKNIGHILRRYGKN